MTDQDIAQGAGVARAQAETLRLRMKLRTVRNDILEVEREARGELRRLRLKLRIKLAEIAAAERDTRKAAGVAGRVVWSRA